MVLTSKQKYNQSEKGKKMNSEYQKKRRANPDNRFKIRILEWKKRGLKYYPNNINEEYEKKQNCNFCNKELKKNFMEHNHITGSFRGFTCSSCNTVLGNNEKNFNLCMKELLFIKSLPSVFNIF